MADKSITKTELVASIASATGESQATVSRVLDSLFGTVSDAVDLYLCRRERETGQPVDRDAIGAAVAAEAIEAATSWLLTLDAPPQAHPAGATPVQP